MIDTNLDDVTIGGGYQNAIEGGGWGSYFAHHATIAGGRENRIVAGGEFFMSPAGATIGGGTRNQIETESDSATIAGGRENHVYRSAAGAIGGGDQNEIVEGDGSSIPGGILNSIVSGDGSMIGGGFNNTIHDVNGSVIGGGTRNTISNATPWLVIRSATIPGGSDNLATAPGSFAAGTRAEARHEGAFIWSDVNSGEAIGSSPEFPSARDDEFAIRSKGGMRVQTHCGIALTGAGEGGPLLTTRGFQANFNATAGPSREGLGRWGLFLAGNSMAIGMPTENMGELSPNYISFTKWDTNGGGTRLMWLDQDGDLHVEGSVYEASDRNKKTNFAPVDVRAILIRVASLPMQTWAYTNNTKVRHIGPVAQDFHAAFAVGDDDKHIATVDADGVALAAIQGLNQIVEQQAKELRRKDARIEELEKRMILIEKALQLGSQSATRAEASPTALKR